MAKRAQSPKKKLSAKRPKKRAEVAVVFAGIRWLVDEIEQISMSKYMSNRKNDVVVIRQLRAAIAMLAAIEEKKPIRMVMDECEYPWERCRDDSCRMDCSGIGGSDF